MSRYLTLWLVRHAQRYLDRAHVTTDPACFQARLPLSGSRLDRYSRGTTCRGCRAAQNEVYARVAAAYGLPRWAR